MRTVIIGGGKGCTSLLELASGSFLKELTLDIQGVMDVNYNAKGMKKAREYKILTSSNMAEILSIPNIELIIELTGNDSILNDIYKIVPPGVKIIDHQFARVFYDLYNARKVQKQRIKEKVELERKLEQERQFLQNIFDGIPDLAVVLDRDRNVMRANERILEFTHISAKDAIGMNCHEIFEGTELGQQCLLDTCPFYQVLATDKPQTYMIKVPPPNEQHWEVTMNPILDGEGKTEAVLVTWHLITERVMLQREIETAELRFIRFIDAADDMISIKDTQGRYVIANPATTNSFGKSPVDFIGKRPEELFPPEVAQMITKHDHEVVTHGIHHKYEETIPINGRDHHFNTVRFPMSDHNGNVMGTCTIARDVTKEKDLQNQLVQSTKLAAVGKLAAGVAHEINNPLTGILAYAEDLVNEMPDDSEFQQDLQVIIRETMRCRKIVRNLLDLSRQDAPIFDDVDANGVVEQVLTLVKKLANFKDIVIEQHLDMNIPHINGDGQSLIQVVLNFMTNAADAMDDKGRIIVRTEYLQKTDKCVITVADNGPGIPENLLEKVFEPFFSTKGTNGLGLAVSWGIIEHHGGSIEVDTVEQGDGAIFKIILPAAK